MQWIRRMPRMSWQLKNSQKWRRRENKRFREKREMTVSVLASTPTPSKLGFKLSSQNALVLPLFTFRFPHSRGFTRLNAGLSEIEPDLEEDKRDRWATNGVSPEDFLYGEYDGHHTYHEGHEGVRVDILGRAGSRLSGWGTPNWRSSNFLPGLISWLFPPAMIAAMAFHVPGEYMYIGAAVWVVIFCVMEMIKPDKPHNFEPQIYNMDREARDKMIADYNTMDIWDFNEKYGELWDFTVKHDNIGK